MASSDPFVSLNKAIANTFGKRTPITLYVSSGALTAGSSFTIDAVVDNPHDLDLQSRGVQLEVWIDGNDPALLIPPRPGDRFTIPNGNVYTVNRVDTDAENGIVLTCRQQG
jgi:hypothetical protein